MLPIKLHSTNEAVNLALDNLTNRRLEKKMRKLNKKTDLTFHMTWPIALAKAIHEFGPNLKNLDTVRILITGLKSHDCLDHLRWIVFLPYMLNKPNMKIQVVAQTTLDFNDNVISRKEVLENIKQMRYEIIRK